VSVKQEEEVKEMTKEMRTTKKNMRRGRSGSWREWNETERRERREFCVSSGNIFSRLFAFLHGIST